MVVVVRPLEHAKPNIVAIFRSVGDVVVLQLSI